MWRLSEALKENVIEEGETKKEFIKRKRNERKKTLHDGKLQGQFVQEHCTQVSNKEWVFEERNRKNSRSSGAGIARVPISFFCFYILQFDIYFQRKKS